MIDDFPPTLAAAAERLAAVKPSAYARSRNALDGAVTRLSPYLTHGLLDLPQVLATLRSQHDKGLEHEDKLVMEFGWREFFHHVWAHEGERILGNLRPPISRLAYSQVLPEDVRSASTGVPVIDQAVRQLYATGYLHNHARMWLASYLVHLRKLHWRTGADWLYAHLLDGDLASNHLSWQWVAGTFSVKPYLFNADNVARYAPPAWHSPGTVIDTSYDALDQLAREQPDCGPEPRRPAPVEPPALLAAPAVTWPALPQTLPAVIQLVQPWDLGVPRNDDWRLGVLHAPFHARFPWSARRWQFVAERLAASCDAVFFGDLNSLRLPLQGCRLSARHTANFGYTAALRQIGAVLEPEPRFLQEPARACSSFSQFYRLAGRAWHV